MNHTEKKNGPYYFLKKKKNERWKILQSPWTILRRKHASRGRLSTLPEVTETDHTVPPWYCPNLDDLSFNTG